MSSEAHRKRRERLAKSKRPPVAHRTSKAGLGYRWVRDGPRGFPRLEVDSDQVEAIHEVLRLKATGLTDDRVYFELLRRRVRYCATKRVAERDDDGRLTGRHKIERELCEWSRRRVQLAMKLDLNKLRPSVGPKANG